MLRLHRAGTRAALAAVTVLAGAAGLTSCAAAHAHAPAADHPQAAVSTGNVLDERLPAAVADAPLVDQDGHRLTLRSLRGKVVVLAPLLTLCQETCPMTTENMHRAAADVAGSGLAGKVVFLEPTVDPARDDVARLHAYAKLYGGLPDWSLVTGRPAVLDRLWKGLGVSTDKAPGGGPVRDWLTGRILEHSYDVHHQDVVLVVDAAGHLRWLTVGRPDARGTRLPGSLRSFLDEEGKHNFRAPGSDAWTPRQVEQAVRYVAAHPARSGAS
jgi:protein SCO1/2